MSKMKCQMLIRLNFCRSVPPEFLRSFLVRSCPLITLIKCLTRLWGHSLKVFSKCIRLCRCLSLCICLCHFIFSVRSCPLITLIKCLKGHSVNQWQGHLLSFQTLVWTAKRVLYLQSALTLQRAQKKALKCVWTHSHYFSIGTHPKTQFMLYLFYSNQNYLFKQKLIFSYLQRALTLQRSQKRP